MAEPELDPLELEPTVPAADVVVVEQLPSDPVPLNRPRKVYAGMWGPFEIAAVAIALMTFLASTFVYFFWVLPSDRELVRNRSEATRLTAELESAKVKYGDITDTETQVARIVASVDDFETRYLPLPANGQTALYQRLNGLIQAYGLVNTAGPDYSPLDVADSRSGGEAAEEEKGRAKHRSLFPGVYVSTTVEGSYQNLRRFIRELETGREFIVLSTVELAPSETQKDSSEQPTNVVQIKPTVTSPDGKGFTTTQNPQVQAQPGRPKPQGKTHGETVSLHIEMAAYFRRPNYAPAGQ